MKYLSVYQNGQRLPGSDFNRPLKARTITGQIKEASLFQLHLNKLENIKPFLKEGYEIKIN